MSTSLHKLKIALVYDRLTTQYGGAEQVLLALHDIFPAAPLYTSVYDAARAPWAKVFDVRTSFLQKIPGAVRFARLFVWLMPLAFESFSFDEFDIVVSVTSAEAKGVLTKPHQLHLCYLLTPTRYLWSHRQEYQRNPLSGWLRRLVFGYLKWWDEVAALRPDILIPISRLVAARCEKFYQRQAAPVIYPPVELSHPIEAQPGDYYLVVARLVPYKRVDLAIAACAELGQKLVIIGDGPDKSRLQSLAQRSPNPSQITFLSTVQPSELRAYYSGCRAFLLPAEEDFGITGLEAQQAGKPVIVYAKSGVAELITDGQTGLHIQEQSVPALVTAIKKLESLSWSQEKISQQVVKYGTKEFQHHFAEQLEKAWQVFTKGTV